MIPEFGIIKLLLNKSIYNIYYKYINIDYIKNNYKELYKIYLVLNNYYTKNTDKESVSLEELEAFYYTQYVVLKEVERNSVSSLFNQIREYPVEETTIINLLNEQKKRALAVELGIACIDYSEGKKSHDDVLSLGKEFLSVEDVQEGEEEKFVTDDLEVLYHDTVQKQGLRWRLKTLNHMLGSLRKGDFGFIFARPETGKTTFLASEISHMASQAETPIAWFNNEEQGNKVMIRCYQAVLGKSLGDLRKDIKGNKERYRELVGEKIKIYDAGSIHRKDVERVCEQIQPSLIIFDQIDKIKGWKDDRHDLVMKEIYQWARELAKKYGPVIAVCQAGGTGEGKKYLTMDDVDSSKTSKQGEADWILGIGKTNKDGEEYVRYLHLSKNKLQGDEDTLPELRHGKQMVHIYPDIARYGDIE